MAGASFFAAASYGARSAPRTALKPALNISMVGTRTAELLAERFVSLDALRQASQEELAAMLTDARLGQVQFRNLSGGIAAMHSAWRI